MALTLPAAVRVQQNPAPGAPGIVVLPASGYRRVRRDLAAWPGYAPTPLHDAPELAARAGIAALRLKDESRRFEVGGVEALGAACAVPHVLLAELARAGVAASATRADLESRCYDLSRWKITAAGSRRHGRAVAWAAHRFGAGCRIVVPEGGQGADGEAYGAEIEAVPGGEEGAFQAASASADLDLLIADTSWPGYTETPRLLMQAYRLMADEAFEQWAGAPPTHIVVEAGNGAIAASVSVQSRSAIAPAPKLVVAAAGPGSLAPAQANLLAWQELERATSAFLEASELDGRAAFLAAAADPEARAALGLDAQSRVLIFGSGAGA